MRIIKAYPPNYSRILEAFPWIKGKNGIIYAWGDRIYNPSGIKIAPWLVAHEEVHGNRQLQGELEEWWHRYLMDPLFRLDEELRAHAIEYYSFKCHQPSPTHREEYLSRIAERLSGDLYDLPISYRNARHEIANGSYSPERATD